jgi:uncharacterized protein
MKKIWLILISLFLGLSIVAASTNTTPRTDDDLGVNKKWNINANNIENVKRTPRVDASEKVYDFAEIMTEAEEAELYNKIKNYIDETHMDMVILTIDKEFSDTEIDDYAVDFYDYNDFGLDYEKYDGIIIVRNINSYNRYFNIHSFGNAQLYYDYWTLEAILDEIYEDIRNDRYLDGFSKFIASARSYYNEGPSKDYYVDDDGYLQKNPPVYVLPLVPALGISGFVTLIVMIVLIKKNKMIKKETSAGVYMDRSTVCYNKKVDQFLHSHTSSYTVSSSSGGGGGHSGGGSHSGSSGGGHSSGGGRHG